MHERKARETYMRALNRLAATAVNARSEARIAYETYRGTYDIAKFYRDRVLPLALRYSNGVLAGEGMRVDLFKYLTDARVRIGANAAALDARRDISPPPTCRPLSPLEADRRAASRRHQHQLRCSEALTRGRAESGTG